MIRLDAEDGEFVVRLPYRYKQVREVLKDTVHGIRWNDPTKTWRTTASIVQMDRLNTWRERVERRGYTVHVTDAAQREGERVVRAQEQAQRELDALQADLEYDPDDILYPFQRRGIEKLKRLNDGTGILAWTVGTGKTAASLILADELDAYPLVCVVPSQVKYQWVHEVRKFLGEDPTVCMLDGFDDTLNPNADITVLNYAILHDRKHDGDVLEGWVHDLAAQQPMMSVFDEAHMLRNADTKRGQAAKRLVDTSEHTLLLSGTPIVNSPDDLAFPLEMLGEADVFGGSWGLKQRYMYTEEVWTGERTVTTFNGAKNLDEFHNVLTRRVMSRVKKEDVLDEMPDLRKERFYVGLSNRGEYRDIENEVLDGDLGGLVRLRQACGKGKVAAATETTHHLIEEGGAPIVFTEFKEQVANPIVNILEEMGHDVSVVTGDVTGQDRDEEVQRFQDETSDVLVATSAGEEGLTLTRAHEMVMVEMPWTPKGVEQRIGRAYARMNDIHGLNVRFLTAEDTIDEAVWNVVEKKRDTVRKIVDGETSTWEDHIIEEYEAIRGDRDG